MKKRPDPGPRLVVLFLLGALLLNYPLLSLFNRDAVVAGVPLQLAYLFATWALMIALLAAVIGRRPG
jgi:hypothetical protein